MQGSDLKSSQKVWGICGKSKIHYVLALIVVVGAGGPMVTGQDESRITSGEIPPAGKYPSIARLVLYKGANGTICAVSIVNRDWVVCAAACVVNYYGPQKVSDLTVVVGDEILNETEPYEREHKVERYIVHHRFERHPGGANTQRGDDIAVIKVTPPIMFSNRVSPSNLPTTCKDPVTGIGLVAGYGRKADLKLNYRLTEITTKIISHEECYELTRRRYDDRVFCVAAINNMSACFNDNGAPLYQFKDDHQMILVGLMNTWPSQGSCGLGENIVGTYTRLSSYVGWIHRRTAGCGNHPWYNVTDYDGPGV